MTDTLNATIADEVASSLIAFEALLVDLASPALNEHLNDFERQFEKFKMWAGNIGAHRKGQNSLDFRLRDASHISSTVHTLLSSLQDVLVESAQISLRHLYLSQTTDDHLAKISLANPYDSSEDSDEESDSGLPGLKPLSPSETISNVLEFVSSTVKSLLRISMAIQNPAPQDRYLSAKTIDTSYYEHFDVEHVRSLYDANRLPDYLIHRLGRANTSRRQFLKYSQAHRARLASGIHGIESGDTKSTVATSLQPEMKQASSRWDRRDQDEVASQTTVNTTAPGIEHVEFVPFPAEASYGEEFQCPLCCCIVAIQDYKHWKYDRETAILVFRHTDCAARSHQLRDLQPYVCVYDNCLTGNRLYASSRDWEAHLAQHLSSSTAAPLDDGCPLCKITLEKKILPRHIASEMQKLSLFVVPPELFDGRSEVDEPSSVEDPQQHLERESSDGATDILSDAVQHSSVRTLRTYQAWYAVDTVVHISVYG